MADERAVQGEAGNSRGRPRLMQALRGQRIGEAAEPELLASPGSKALIDFGTD